MSDPELIEREWQSATVVGIAAFQRGEIADALRFHRAAHARSTAEHAMSISPGVTTGKRWR
jgi:hypothetical protein